jgi:hypothetical protein
MTNITTFIDPTSFKDLGTLQYWINNNKKIWDNISIKFGLNFGIEIHPSNNISIKKDFIFFYFLLFFFSSLYYPRIFIAFFQIIKRCWC